MLGYNIQWDPLAMYIVHKVDWQSQITRVRHMAWKTRAHHYHMKEIDVEFVLFVRAHPSLSSYASLSLRPLLSHFGYQMYPMHKLCRVGVPQPKCSYRISLVNCNSHKHPWAPLYWPSAIIYNTVHAKLIFGCLLLKTFFGCLLLKTFQKWILSLFIAGQWVGISKTPNYQYIQYTIDKQAHQYINDILHSSH